MVDVLGRIPPSDRPALFAQLRALLRPGAQLILSTPHPACTNWRRERADDGLQIIDEAVELPEILRLAGAQELELTHYQAYDIAQRRQYQLFVFETLADPSEAPQHDPRLPRRLTIA